MAGIIAAGTDNGTGIAGIGFDGVKVMPVTVLDADGLGQDSDIIEGIVWAVDHGADVINLSFSNPGFSSALQAAVDYAWDHDVVVVAATGNDGSGAPTYPAGDRGVVGVSNTNRADELERLPRTTAPTRSSPRPAPTSTRSPAGGGHDLGHRHVRVVGRGRRGGRTPARDRPRRLQRHDRRAASRRSAADVGTRDETGNGRLDLARAVADHGDGRPSSRRAPRPTGERRTVRRAVRGRRRDASERHDPQRVATTVTVQRGRIDLAVHES